MYEDEEDMAIKTRGKIEVKVRRGHECLEKRPANNASSELLPLSQDVNKRVGRDHGKSHYAEYISTICPILDRRLTPASLDLYQLVLSRSATEDGCFRPLMAKLGKVLSSRSTTLPQVCSIRT